MIRESMRAGLADGGGAVVTISAIDVRKLVLPAALYTAGKAAPESPTRTLALDLASDGVRVNAIAPRLVKTEPTRLMREQEGREAL